MKTIPTAEEFYINSDVHLRTYEDHDDNLLDDLSKLMIEFAKLHVEAALKEASEKVTMLDNGSIDTHGMWFEYYQVDKNSILNAYPLTLIK